METNEGLKRKVGVWGLSSNIINIMIGAGIFVLPATVAEGLGSSAVVAYLFCGFLISIIMLCFAELGSKVTLSGGAYVYIEKSFGKYIGFLTANIFVFGAAIMADAAVANALADMIAYVFPAFGTFLIRSAFFLLIFSGLAFINVRGIKEGITLVKLITIAKLTPLFILIMAGWTYISFEDILGASTPSIGELATSGEFFRRVGEVSLVLFFAFQGSETGLNIGGEVKNPARTFPRGILVSILGTLILYILVQLTAQGVLGDSLGNFSDAPLAEVAKTILGPWGVNLILIGACISMFGNLSGEVLNLPRVIFGAARDKVLPVPALAKVHPKYATPYVAIICYASLACLFAITGEFKQLAILSSAAMLLIYLGVAISVIRFRKIAPSEPGTFKIPGGYLVPVLAVITILWFLSNLKKEEIIGILIFIAVLSVIYLFIFLSEKRRLR